MPCRAAPVTKNASLVIHASRVLRRSITCADSPISVSFSRSSTSPPKPTAQRAPHRWTRKTIKPATPQDLRPLIAVRKQLNPPTPHRFDLVAQALQPRATRCPRPSSRSSTFSGPGHIPHANPSFSAVLRISQSQSRTKYLDPSIAKLQICFVSCSRSVGLGAMQLWSSPRRRS